MLITVTVLQLFSNKTGPNNMIYSYHKFDGKGFHEFRRHCTFSIVTMILCTPDFTRKLRSMCFDD